MIFFICAVWFKWIFFPRQGIMDTLAAGEHRGLKPGKLVVLSKNFPGSDRDV